MGTVKIAISIDRSLLIQIDQMEKENIFPSRSQAIQHAIQEKLSRWNHSRLAQECFNLDVRFEQALAEEGFSMK